MAKRTITTPLEEDCYPTDNEKRGLCLVFEHDEFAPYLGLRLYIRVTLKIMDQEFHQTRYSSTYSKTFLLCNYAKIK